MLQGVRTSERRQKKWEHEWCLGIAETRSSSDSRGHPLAEAASTIESPPPKRRKGRALASGGESVPPGAHTGIISTCVSPSMTVYMGGRGGWLS